MFITQLSTPRENGDRGAGTRELLAMVQMALLMVPTLLVLPPMRSVETISG